MQRFARVTSGLSLVIAFAVVAAAGGHALQWDTPAYRTSMLISFEIIVFSLCIIGLLPQLIATVYLVWHRKVSVRWAVIGAVALLGLPASAALAMFLDAATLIRHLTRSIRARSQRRCRTPKADESCTRRRPRVAR